MKTLLKSILTGAGFAIGLLLVFFIWGQINKVMPASRGIFSHGREESIVGKNYALIINDRFQNKTDTTVVGTITNTTDQALGSVIVEASIFDTSGTFLTKEQEYVTAIRPHETFNFKINFSMPYGRRGSNKKQQNGDPIRVEAINKVETKIKQGYLMPASFTSDRPVEIATPEILETEIQPLKVHIVYPGETFDDIARHYRVSAEDIRIVNGIREGEPPENGSKLVIP